MVKYDVPPEVSLLSLFLKRGRGLGGGSIPLLRVEAARLVGDPAKYREVCGFADALPLTWPGILAQPLQAALMTQKEFPLSLMGIVHVSQKIIRHRYIHPSESLSACCEVLGHRVVKSGGEFDLITTVSSQGERVWEGTTTILSRQIQGDGQSRPRAEFSLVRPMRSAVWRLPADQGWRYAAVSGDYNPIHLSAWSARLFGFKRPIVHGWWTLGRALAELDKEIPEKVIVEAKFLAPVSLPGEVIFESEPGRFVVRNRKGSCLVGTFA